MNSVMFHLFYFMQPTVHLLHKYYEVNYTWMSIRGTVGCKKVKRVKHLFTKINFFEASKNY
jgi:hypothetical protein